MYVYNSQFVSARGVHRNARNGEKCVGENKIEIATVKHMAMAR